MLYLSNVKKSTLAEKVFLKHNFTLREPFLWRGNIFCCIFNGKEWIKITLENLDC